MICVCALKHMPCKYKQKKVNCNALKLGLFKRNLTLIYIHLTYNIKS